MDNFYPGRPDNMEEICLYDFVAEYEKCGVDGDGNPVYRERTKPILPNHSVSVRITNILSFSCSFPFATRQTSLKRGRLPTVLLNVTWKKTMHSAHTLKSFNGC